MTSLPGEWTPLAADASSRRYRKGIFEGREAILAEFGEDQDGLDRFVQIQALFAANDIPVPEILRVESSGRWIVQEFVPGWPLSKGRWTGSLQHGLLEIAAKIGALTQWPEDLDLLSLDEARLRFEMAFFRLHFLEGYLNTTVQGRVIRGLDALAEEVASYPQYLAHRDFHSENLLIRADGNPVVIDFQDALLAPRDYDAASLAVDPYRSQNPRISAGFRDIWLRTPGTSPLEFDRTALQRGLKALGTFGYQVTRRKRARFMRTMIPQARRVLDLLDRAPLPLDDLRPLLEDLPG
jgi:aminoglycoside/choline kinase family phosphotransferase